MIPSIPSAPSDVGVCDGSDAGRQTRERPGAETVLRAGGAARRRALVQRSNACFGFTLISRPKYT